MKTKSLAILVISIILIAGGTGIILWNNRDPGDEEPQLNIAYYAYNPEPILDWDPSVCFSDGLIVLNNVYETLLKYDPVTETFDPVLATSYIQSDDGMHWNFTLRENVTFHDGTPFNASAVKYSIERTLYLDLGAAFIWWPVDTVNITSEYEVQINLFYPTPLDLIVSCPHGAFMMSPEIENQPATWFENGNEAGTGPYKLNSTVAGDEVVLDKYDEYWGGWEDDQFDKVFIRRVSETANRRSLIESGEADIVGYLPPADIDALISNPDVNVSENLSFTNMFAHFNTEKEPLNDSRVRQALAYAFPYQDVVDTAAGGYAEQSTGIVPAGLWGHSDDLFQYSHNLTKASELLAEAGIANDTLSLSLTYTSGDEAQRITAELYLAELAKIHVELTIEGLPWTSQWERAKSTNPDDRQDIYMIYWWPDLSTPFSWLFNQYVTPEEDYIAFNLAYYSNYDVDDLVFWADEESAFNRTYAEEIYYDAQAIIIEDCPSIFIYDQKDVFALNPTFQGFDYNPSYPNTVFFYECYRTE